MDDRIDAIEFGSVDFARRRVPADLALGVLHLLAYEPAHKVSLTFERRNERGAHHTGRSRNGDDHI
jgi:hypothetical protein